MRRGHLVLGWLSAAVGAAAIAAAVAFGDPLAGLVGAIFLANAAVRATLARRSGREPGTS